MSNSEKDPKSPKSQKQIDTNDTAPERDTVDSLKDKERNVTTGDAMRDVKSRERSRVDIAHGDDQIEIEANEGKGLSDMGTYAPMDGDLGDESEDTGDLPIEDRKNKNYYDPSLSTGGKRPNRDPENPEGMHISKGGKAGLSYRDDDSYVNEESDERKGGSDNKKK